MENMFTTMAQRVFAEVGQSLVTRHHLGKAQIILLSWKRGASIFKPWTWVLDAQPSRFFKILH